MDSCYDIGRIEDVHWNPWCAPGLYACRYRVSISINASLLLPRYSDNATYLLHQTTQGVGFLIARTDWEYFSGTFVFGMVGWERRLFAVLR